MKLTVEKSGSKCALLLQIKKTPKVGNHPLEENSPNLVTLIAGDGGAISIRKPLSVYFRCWKFSQGKKTNRPVLVAWCYVVVSANITEDRGFESRPGCKVFGTLKCCTLRNLNSIVIFVFE
jgi:hypothetical protein